MPLAPPPDAVAASRRGKVLRSRQTKTAADYFLRWRKYFPSEESWSVIMSAVAGRLTARWRRRDRREFLRHSSRPSLVTWNRLGSKCQDCSWPVTAGHCMIMPGWMFSVKCKMCKLLQLLVSIAPLLQLGTRGEECFQHAIHNMLEDTLTWTEGKCATYSFAGWSWSPPH